MSRRSCAILAHAIGARIGVVARIRGRSVSQWREISGQTGYNGQNSLRAHFGLADASVVERLTIHWPSGAVDEYNGVRADQFLVAVEGEDLTPVR